MSESIYSLSRNSALEFIKDKILKMSNPVLGSPYLNTDIGKEIWRVEMIGMIKETRDRNLLR